MKVDNIESDKQLKCQGGYQYAICSYLCGLSVYDTPALRCHFISPVSNQSQVVAAAETLLQEERGATAAHLAVGYDGNAISQDVRLIHVVSGQNDGATCKGGRDRNSIHATPEMCTI